MMYNVLLSHIKCVSYKPLKVIKEIITFHQSTMEVHMSSIMELGWISLPTLLT